MSIKHAQLVRKNCSKCPAGFAACTAVATADPGPQLLIQLSVLEKQRALKLQADDSSALLSAISSPHSHTLPACLKSGPAT